VTSATKCSDVAGSPYPISGVADANPTYHVTVIDGRLFILPRPATVTANDKTKLYLDVIPSLDATVTNEATDCETVHYSLRTDATQLSDAGPYQITVSLGINPNYVVTTSDTSFTIQ